MNNTLLKISVVMICIAQIWGCKKDQNTTTPPVNEPNLVFKFMFDSTQVRLNSFGQPATLASGHSAQSPHFNQMSAHYIELAPTAWTALGSGDVIYKNAETTSGGSTAIDFSKSIRAANGETFFSIPVKSVSPGTYQYLRVSLAYQNYDINLRVNNMGTDYDLQGTLASFIGFNTYVQSFKIKDSTVVLNANRNQGYWAFEVKNNIYSIPVGQGQAPSGATTVPNPIATTSPIPSGSCVVTGPFTSPLIITGNETNDIVISVSLSTNKSFEWVDHSNPSYYEPLAGDTVIDMGIRGLIPIVN